VSHVGSPGAARASATAGASPLSGRLRTSTREDTSSQNTPAARHVRRHSAGVVGYAAPASSAASSTADRPSGADRSRACASPTTALATSASRAPGPPSRRARHTAARCRAVVSRAPSPPRGTTGCSNQGASTSSDTPASIITSAARACSTPRAASRSARRSRRETMGAPSSASTASRTPRPCAARRARSSAPSETPRPEVSHRMPSRRPTSARAEESRPIRSAPTSRLAPRRPRSRTASSTARPPAVEAHAASAGGTPSLTLPPGCAAPRPRGRAPRRRPPGAGAARGRRSPRRARSRTWPTRRGR